MIVPLLLCYFYAPNEGFTIQPQPSYVLDFWMIGPFGRTVSVAFVDRITSAEDSGRMVPVSRRERSIKVLV